MRSRALAPILGALIAIGCDPGAPPPVDSGPPDSGTTPPLTVRIAGRAHALVGDETCFDAETSAGPTARFEWVFGDGERAQTDRPHVCHAYTLVGARVLGVTVIDGARRAEATHALSVVFRPAAIAPTRSSPIVRDGDRLFVVSEDADRLAVIGTAPFARIAEAPVGARPRTVAVSEGIVAIACQGDGTLHLLDRDGGAIAVAALGTGTEPYGVLADPRGGGFFVSLRGTGEIASVALDGAIRARVAVGPEPRGLAMNGEGTLIATRWRGTMEGAEVYTVDASDPRAPHALGATLLPRQDDVDSDTDNRGVLGFLDQAVPSPDGRRAVLPGLKANVVSGLFRTGEALRADTTARAALGEVTFGAPDARATDSFRHSFDDLGYASAAVFSPLGERLYVAFQGAQTVVAIDAFDFFSVGSVDDVGEAPNGLALSEDGRVLYVAAFLSRSVRAYDVTELSREPALLGEVSTVAREPLASDVLEGKRVFYRSRDPRMSQTRYLSCASCHLDGESDGLTWDFTQRGEGLRNTISLRGAAARAPLHWSANFDEVQDFEHDIRDGQGGDGFLSDALFHADGRDAPLGAPKAGLSPELDALAAYVASLDRVGVAPPGDEGAIARGESVFARAGCDGCHTGAALTDSAFVDGAPILHDVGTLSPASGTRLGAPLTGLDTPTLRGLWRSAPYLHDGSAPTLRDVLTTRNLDDRHGVTSDLTDAERDDLVAFLMSLGD